MHKKLPKTRTPKYYRAMHSKRMSKQKCRAIRGCSFSKKTKEGEKRDRDSERKRGKREGKKEQTREREREREGERNMLTQMVGIYAKSAAIKSSTQVYNKAIVPLRAERCTFGPDATIFAPPTSIRQTSGRRDDSLLGGEARRLFSPIY